MRTTLVNTVRQDDDLISPAELAAYLDVPQQTVYVWRYEGRGPRAIKVGRHIRFRWSDVKTWLEANADPAV